MRIAIPTEGKGGLDDKAAEHFGRCPTYTILDENGELIEIIENTSEHMGGTGLPPELMKKNNINIMLCRGLGYRAIELFNGFGIDVYVCQEKTAKDMFDKWKSGELKKAGKEDACEH